MRATIMYGAGHVRVENVPDPVIKAPTDAIVRVVRAAICGSDLHPTASCPRAFDDPAIAAIAQAHGKTPAQVMIRWHLQEGRSAIPKSVHPERIAENFGVFNFDLTTDELATLDALDTGVRGGPEPKGIALENFGRTIPEA